MRFVIDNGLPRRMAAGLSAAGHDAIHVGDWGLATASDSVIFERAAADNRIVVALDTDFGTLLARRTASRPSVVLFRTQAKSVDALLPALIESLPVVSAELDAGAVVVIEDARIRIRRLPINR